MIVRVADQLHLFQSSVFILPVALWLACGEKAAERICKDELGRLASGSADCIRSWTIICRYVCSIDLADDLVNLSQLGEGNPRYLPIIYCCLAWSQNDGFADSYCT